MRAGPCSRRAQAAVIVSGSATVRIGILREMADGGTGR